MSDQPRGGAARPTTGGRRREESGAFVGSGKCSRSSPQEPRSRSPAHDVERCARFDGALGLPEAFRATVDGRAAHIEVQEPGFRVGLTAVTAIQAMGMPAVPRGASAELVRWCDDVDAASAIAFGAGAGAGRLGSPEGSPDGRLRDGRLHDPDGHTRGLVQHVA